jgi:mannose-6-phosphate isomerase-like protein (cupin superfamily)
MHVTAGQLRTVRRDGLIVRFAQLGSVAFVVAEIPETGTRGTTLEEACIEPHWSIVLSGTLGVVRPDGPIARVGAGQAFHVPAGVPAHSFQADGRVSAAGFAPLPSGPIDRGTIRQAGYEELAPDASRLALPPVDEVTVASGAAVVPIRRGAIEADAALMGPWVYCQATFGGESGYTSRWCDLPHWGMVLAGTMAIEWEDDLEIVGAGDAYYCPRGPAGHRFQVTDSATIIDFTPLDALVAGGRTAEWRPTVSLTPSGADAGLPAESASAGEEASTSPPVARIEAGTDTAP